MAYPSYKAWKCLERPGISEWLDDPGMLLDLANMRRYLRNDQHVDLHFLRIISGLALKWLTKRKIMEAKSMPKRISCKSMVGFMESYWFPSHHISIVSGFGSLPLKNPCKCRVKRHFQGRQSHISPISDHFIFWWVEKPVHYIPIIFPLHPHYLHIFPYGGFLKWGYPQSSSISECDFPISTIQLLGYPHDYGTPHRLSFPWLTIINHIWTNILW